MENVHAILLSGGGGTRLWPVSNERRPKQFLSLFGELSLFQLTLERVKACGIKHIHVVTNAAYAHDVQSQADGCGIPISLILEPMRRDSAPAIAAGLAFLHKDYGETAIAVVLPCDHLIPNHGDFRDALHDAVIASRHGYLTTFGILPTSPSTEYGYIRKGEKIEISNDVFRAQSFREKPDLNTAQSYLISGDYFWNSGMFVFQTSTFAKEAKLYMPQIWEAACDAVNLGQKSGSPGSIIRLQADAFSQAEKISIDYALFEKSQCVAILPRHFAWSDVGNWSSVHEALDHDADGNAAGGDVAIHESKNTLVYSEGLRVIALGLHDVVVIASPEGVFIAPKSRAAEIKSLL